MEKIELSSIHPTKNLILVHLRPGIQQTKSGIVIPPNSQQINQWGDILATGPEAAAICSPGQLVLVGLHAGTHVTWHQNTPVILVSINDCLALLEPGEAIPDAL